MDKIIEVKDLTKDYGHGRGVFDISFEVKKGEVFGFLGPNGAGKTTTIRHIMGFSNPEKGETKVFNMSSFKKYNLILNNLGYLPGEIAIPDGLNGWEFIKMMQGLRKVVDEKRLYYLLDKFDLNPKVSIKKMSFGTKRKLAIVTAFMSDPDVLVLDEPTSGLDPIMQKIFIEFIKEEKARGKTILLSSHIFSEVDATCDRIAIIKDGKIVSTFVVNDIKHNKNKTFKIEFNNNEDYRKFLELDYEVVWNDEEKRVVKIYINDEKINELITSIKNLDIKYFREIKFTLEDYFMKFYKDSHEFGGIE